MARLVQLNGVPGIGKSSVGRRYLEDHPLALLVEIDGIRTALGCWEQVEESKLVARSLAIALVEHHLHNARDVIIPQYLGRRDFIETLEGVARECEATFVEVVLDAPVAVAVERFRRRRSELLRRGEHHPQTDLSDEAVEAAVQDALARLTRLMAERDDAIRIDADRPMEAAYANLLAALRTRVT